MGRFVVNFKITRSLSFSDLAETSISWRLVIIIRVCHGRLPKLLFQLARPAKKLSTVYTYPVALIACSLTSGDPLIKSWHQVQTIFGAWLVPYTLRETIMITIIVVVDDLPSLFKYELITDIWAMDTILYSSTTQRSGTRSEFWGANSKGTDLDSFFRQEKSGT